MGSDERRKLKFTEFETAVLESMLDRYYSTRIKRLESINTSNGREFEKWTVFVCIEARVIATFLLDLYIGNFVLDEENEANHLVDKIK